MEVIPMKVELREETGKGPARRLRAAGAIPAVAYGRGRDTIMLAVSRQELERLYKTGDSNVLIDLEVPGEDREANVAAIVKALQRDPVTRAPMSIDFQWISLKESIEVEIPITVHGSAPGVDEDGGVVQQQYHTVTVACLPTVIPESVSADITGMTIGDVLFVSDLPEIEGVTYMAEADDAVLTIAPPISEEDLEAQIDDELLDSLVDLEVGDEVVEAEELVGDEEEDTGATEGAQVDVQEADDVDLD